MRALLISEVACGSTMFAMAIYYAFSARGKVRRADFWLVVVGMGLMSVGPFAFAVRRLCAAHGIYSFSHVLHQVGRVGGLVGIVALVVGAMRGGYPVSRPAVVDQAPLKIHRVLAAVYFAVLLVAVLSVRRWLAWVGQSHWSSASVKSDPLIVLFIGAGAELAVLLAVFLAGVYAVRLPQMAASRLSVVLPPVVAPLISAGVCAPFVVRAMHLYNEGGLWLADLHAFWRLLAMQAVFVSLLSLFLWHTLLGVSNCVNTPKSMWKSAGTQDSG